MRRNLTMKTNTISQPFWQIALSLLLCSLSWPSVVRAQNFYQPGGAAPYVQPQAQVQVPAQGQIQQVAVSNSSTGKPKKAHPYQIVKMPESTEKLDVIHQRSQLIVTRSKVLRIAIDAPEIVEVVQYSPTELGVIGANLGTATVSFWFESDADPLIYLVEVIRDPSLEDRLKTDFGKLEKQLQVLFPNSKVYLIPLQQRLVVKGQAANEQEAAHILQIVRSAMFNEYALAGYGYGYGYGGAGYGGRGGDNNFGDNDDDEDDDDIVNMLEVPGNHQVMLHVKIAEISRGHLRRLGVDLSATIGNVTAATQGLAQLAGQSSGLGLGGLGLAGAAASAGGGSAGNTTFSITSSEATLLLNFLATNHSAKVLAAPTLTVLSGHEATFLAGGEFPVQTVVGLGTNGASNSTSFRRYGTQLSVRPEVIDRDWIKLEITPSLSNLDGTVGANATPGISNRTVSTTVKLREGQTIVLAGLYGHTGSTNSSRVPMLGELPLIGKLFNNRNASMGENELLIIVTPELVRAMEPDEVPPMPGFYVTWPNDIELYHYSKTEGYPDQGVYQLSPLGWGPGYASEVGYRPFNAAPAQSAFGSGGGSIGAGGYGGPMTGSTMPAPTPAAIYPGGPVPAQNPNGQPQTQMAPAPIQPTPDPNMGMQLRNGGVQQVGYEAPPKRSWISWPRGQQTPAATSTPQGPNGRQPAQYPQQQMTQPPQQMRGRY